MKTTTYVIGASEGTSLRDGLLPAMTHPLDWTFDNFRGKGGNVKLHEKVTENVSKWD